MPFNKSIYILWLIQNIMKMSNTEQFNYGHGNFLRVFYFFFSLKIFFFGVDTTKWQILNKRCIRFEWLSSTDCNDIFFKSFHSKWMKIKRSVSYVAENIYLKKKVIIILTILSFCKPFYIFCLWNSSRIMNSQSHAWNCILQYTNEVISTATSTFVWN